MGTGLQAGWLESTERYTERHAGRYTEQGNLNSIFPSPGLRRGPSRVRLTIMGDYRASAREVTWIQ